MKKVRFVIYPEDFRHKALNIFGSSETVNNSFKYGNDLVGWVIYETMGSIEKQILNLMISNDPDKLKKLQTLLEKANAQRDLYEDFNEILQNQH